MIDSTASVVIFSSDPLEPITTIIVTNENFSVRRLTDPDGTVPSWYEIRLADDHTAEELRAALTYLPATSRAEDRPDWDGDTRTYFYGSGVINA